MDGNAKDVIIKNDKPQLGDALMILAMMQQLQREGKDVAYNGNEQITELLYRAIPLCNDTGNIDVTSIRGDWNGYAEALNLDWNGQVADLGWQAEGNKIGVCCVSRDFRRCYPHEKYLVKLCKRYGEVVVLGHEYLPYWKLIQQISSLKILISTNNGIAHLAGCLKVPLIIIEGPFDCRELYGWYGNVRYVNYNKLNCRPCGEKQCTHASCLYLIHPKEIIQQAFELNRIVVDLHTDNHKRGFGDIIMSTVIAKAFKQQYRHIPVTYVVRDNAKQLVLNNPYIDLVVSKRPKITNRTNYIKIGYAIENYSLLRNRRNRIDSLLIYAGVSTDDKKPILRFPRIPSNYRKRGKMNIGVSIQSASPTRTWPIEYLHKLVSSMPQCAFHVFSIEAIKTNDTNIINHNLDFINLTNAISQMDKVFCVDSLISHISGALDIPTVTLYTIVKAKWRNKYYNNIGIQSPKSCSPCMECQFGVAEGCNPSTITPCVLAISPEIVYDNLWTCSPK